MSIVGYLDMSHGFLLFPSREAYEAFQVGAERSVARQDPIPDLGTDWLSFTLEPASGVSARLRREAASRGWAATDSGTYPVAGHYTREGIFRPPAARELKILLACAQALSAFMLRHGSIFAMDLPEPVCESQYDDNDLEVRLTVPYEASGMFDLTTGAQPGLPGRSLRPAGPRIARNAPCPCGSGKKYKKCHLESAPPGAEGKRADPIHDLDLELNRSLSRYGEARFGRSWYLFADDFIDPMAAIQLSLPWSLFHVQVNGKSVAEWYARENGRRIPRQTREWLAAQQAAWLSVWEVFSVQPGVGMEIRDQLSGETRFVHEVSASETLKPRDAMLARIADHQGKSFLVGAHPSLLPPEEAAEVIRLARGRLRRKRAVPVERLRNLRFSRYLIQNWEAAAIQFEHRRAVPPHLTNTAGEPLTLTTDHFELSPGSRMAVEKRLATLEGVEPPDPVEDELVYVLLQKAPSSRPHQLPVVLGRAILTETALRLETNSRERADALRARVEAACGDLVRHRAREHVDPLSSQVRSRHAAAGNDPPPAAEQLEAIREWKKTYYADWIDQPIPALGGQTPRVAAGTAAGRRDLNILLKSLENSEARVQDGTGFDFSQIRRNLRIDDAELS